MDLELESQKQTDNVMAKKGKTYKSKPQYTKHGIDNS